ncbi:hypothetical protein KAR91_55800 [Candidatus Pacearchaeota archaeon]|nr:hypothetical protein [Candidatus Pacearchaeota archaeon]
MDFKEKRTLQKSITESLSKLEAGELSFKEKRDIQKGITADFVKLGEKAAPEILTPVYDKLKNGDFVNLPASEFIDKLKESAKELGVEESLTESIIDPANAWKEKREEVASEGVDTGTEEVDDFLDGEEIALEDVKTKLNIGDKFKLKGKVSHIDTQESSKKKRNYNSITVEFPFNFDWGGKTNSRYTAHFTLKDDESHPFKIGDEITLDVKLQEFKGKKPKKEGDPPIVYYGLYFESPDGFRKQKSEHVSFASERVVLEHMEGEVPATESSKSEEKETDTETPANEGSKETETDEQEFELSTEQEEELVNEIKESDQPDPELATEGIATEKAKNVDEKLWKYAKKIVLKARFDKEPSGDNEKDNETITEGKAWGFVQERYQKLVSGKIKARKPATESVDEIEVELVINETEIPGDPSKSKELPATESVDENAEIEDVEEIII